MTETADADEVLITRVGRRHYNSDTISQVVGGVVEQLVKAQWGSCASTCFESSMVNCDPDSFVALKRKILTADGGCHSDGTAWRRYHIPVDKYMIALGDAYGQNRRQFDVLTFAMPPFVASNFATPVSVVAVPVAKGILIKTSIEAGYTDDDTITLRQRPELIYKLHHKVNGLPYVALVNDNTVRQRGLRMELPFDLLPYTDDKAMKMLSAQWEHHDPGNTYWPTVEQCFTQMTVEHIHRGVSIENSSTSYDLDPSDYCHLKTTARSNGNDDRKQHLT